MYNLLKIDLRSKFFSLFNLDLIRMIPFFFKTLDFDTFEELWKIIVLPFFEDLKILLLNLISKYSKF